MSEPEEQCVHQVIDESNDFKFDFETLRQQRENELFIDATLQCTVVDDKGLIFCHRVILANRSPYFARQFGTPEFRLKKSIYINDLTYKVVKAIVDYIYSQGEITTLDKENVLEIYKGASKFELDALQRKCLNTINGFIDTGGVVDKDFIIKALTFAQQHNLIDLLKLCVNCVWENLGDYSAYFPDFGAEKIKLLIEHRHETVTAEDLLKTVVAWLGMKTEEERRQYSWELIRNIPFLELSLDVLVDVFHENKFLREITEVNYYYVDSFETLFKCKFEKTENVKAEVVDVPSKNSTEAANTQPKQGPSKRRRSSSKSSNSSSKSVETSRNKRNKVSDDNHKSPDRVTKTQPVIVFCNDGFREKKLLSIDLLMAQQSKRLNTFNHHEPGCCLVYHNGKIISIGGQNNEGGSGKVDSVDVAQFDLKVKVWQYHRIRHIPGARSHFKCVILNNYVYVIGGLNECAKLVNRVQRLNLRSKTAEWETVAEPLYCRSDFAACVLNDCIYIVGGYTTLASQSQKSNGAEWIVSNSMECYDPVKNEWEEKCAMHTKRVALAVVAADSKIYALGGGLNYDSLDYKEMFNNVEVYDPKSDSWQVSSPMRWNRQRFAAVNFKNHIFVVGGDSRKEPTLERFDIVKGKWDKCDVLHCQHGVYENSAYYNE